MKSLILSFILIVLYTSSTAQDFKGQVVGTDNKAISFVNVYTINNTKHVHTADDGSFVLKEIKQGDTIKFSCLGYETTQYVVSPIKKEVIIILKKNAVLLADVIIKEEIDALNLFSNVNLKSAPVQNAQEILLDVPGLMIGQHAGGGKAEQIFLRGFDIDHGTDIGISVENMPVNMVSHAHGQGYADMHFLIAETIDRMDFGKGPYEADKGNFATAGYVDLKLKNSLDHNEVKVEYGQFNTKRMLGMINVLNNEKQKAYIATEFIATDGPFESSQNFKRSNFLARYNAQLSPNDNLSISASHFTSRWDASGQVPQRAVDNNLITRFGAIDDTEGGETSRTNVWLNYTKVIGKTSYLKTNAYYTAYDFLLFSNFTFFLNDSINGDQIKQAESRVMTGGQVEYGSTQKLLGKHTNFKTGVGFRNDRSKNNELSHTANRKTTLEYYQLGDVDETNIYAYAQAEIALGKLIIQPGVRADELTFGYKDALATTYNNEQQSAFAFSPKLNFIYNYSNDLQLYLKSGKGFHSNDSRVVLSQSQRKNLPGAYGNDLGFIWKPRNNFLINAALWQLYLEQEFVYVGDEGIVEPSGKTYRSGIDFSIRYQPKPWLVASADINYAHARALETNEGEAFIPLAPNLTMAGRIEVIHPSGFFGGWRTRHIADRAATENNAIVAAGYTVSDANVGYSFKRFDLGCNVKNIFNTQWNETQFATTSRLKNESEAVEEIHFTPGTPLAVTAFMRVKF